MKLRNVFFLLAALVTALAGCSKTPAGTPPSTSSAPADVDPIYGHWLHAQTNLPTIKLTIDNQELTAEICRQQLEIATGMMFRTNMLETQGMIFVFSDAEPRSFYMRNCSVALSAAYISPSGKILQIIDMKPFDQRGIPSESSNIQFVLEVPQGWFSRHNIGPGAIIRTERGTLEETFFGKH
jgi:uncharacterized membrane protein (UPF0127 family)/predicted small lipoprotein YifL